MTMFRLFVSALLALWWLPSHSHAETPLRIACSMLPPGKGNPYTSTNIATGCVYSAVFDTLTHMTHKGRLMPWLAESWEQERPDTWVFRLQANLKFSNGEPLDAEAVIASIEYLTGPGKFEAGSREIQTIISATALDARTIEVITNGPDFLLPNKMSTLWVLPPKRWRELGRERFALDPVGSGAYRVVEWSENTVTMEKWPGAWRGGPTEKVEILGIIEASARVAALTSGRVDAAHAAAEPDTIPLIERTGGWVSYEQLPSVIAIVFNAARDARFRDLRVRRALNHAVNRQAIVDRLLDGRSTVSSQMVHPTNFGYDPDLSPYPYDVARARDLLAEAGHGSGFGFTMEMAAGGALWDSTIVQVAADLRAVGVDMTIRVVPPQTLHASVQSGEWSADAWTLPLFSPSFNGLQIMEQHSCLWHTPWYCDRETADLIEGSIAAPDFATSQSLAQAALARAQDQAQALPLYNSIGFVGLSKRVKSYVTDFYFVRYDLIELRD